MPSQNRRLNSTAPLLPVPARPASHPHSLLGPASSRPDSCGNGWDQLLASMRDARQQLNPQLCGIGCWSPVEVDHEPVLLLGNDGWGLFVSSLCVAAADETLLSAMFICLPCTGAPTVYLPLQEAQVVNEAMDAPCWSDRLCLCRVPVLPQRELVSEPR